MQLSETASWLLVIGYVFLSLVTAVALAGIALALNKLNAKLEELTAKADPLLEKADQVLATTNEKITSIGDKAEDILAQGEEVAENVHHKVDRTATAVQRTVHAPIIGLNSLAAGVSRGFETFGKLQRGKANGAALPAAQAPREDKIYTENGRDAAEPIPVPTGKETIHAG